MVFLTSKLRIFFLIAATALLVVSVSAAEPEIPIEKLTPMQQFAVDGLATGRLLMNQHPQRALSSFGLPIRIEIHRDRAGWDIDIEETPAEWIYDGFTITTPYLRSANTSNGEWVPGIYGPSDFIDQITVTSSSVNVRLGVGVGTPFSEVEKILSDSIITSSKEKGRILMQFGTAELIGRGVTVIIDFDENKLVKQITWSRMGWH